MKNLVGIFCPGIPAEFLRETLVRTLGSAVPPDAIAADGGFAGCEFSPVAEPRPANGEKPAGRQTGYGFIDGEIREFAFSASAADTHVRGLKHARGSFAGALWDAAAGRLFLFRDHTGTRPLYYGWTNLPLPNGESRRAAVFASTLGLLRPLPGFAPVVRRAAVTQMIARSCCHDCIWEDFFRLPPGGIMTLTREDCARGEFPRPAVYWSAADARAAAKERPFAGNAADAEAAVLDALRTGIRGFFSTPAPRGILLSGGIDSALVAGICALEKLPVTAFTLQIADSRYDETAAAAAIARYLRITHHAVEVTEKTLTDSVHRIPEIWDEPFADSSQIPTYLVCRAAGEFSPRILTGDAGDENFGGYERYQTGDYFWRYWRKIPAFFRRAGSRCLQKIPAAWGNRLNGGARYPRFFGDKLHRLARAAGAADFASFYRQLTVVPGAEKALRDFPPGGGLNPEDYFPTTDKDFSAQAMGYDWATYLPEDLLVKTDRVARAANLEIFSPFLDPAIIELAFALPMSQKIVFSAGRITGKHVLRRLLRRFLPAESLLPQKKGFGVPIDTWLRGPLRAWADAVFQEHAFAEDPILDALSIRQMWQEHLDGRHNFAPLLWNVLMYREWRNHYCRT